MYSVGVTTLPLAYISAGKITFNNLPTIFQNTVQFNSSIFIDTITEKTVDAGVTVDGVKLKDSVPYVDTIAEKTDDAGVTVDGVKLKDSVPYVDTIAEKTADAGVTVDGVKLKDSNIFVDSPELVINGTFDSNISDWTDASTGGGSIAWNASGKLNCVAVDASNRGKALENITTVIGKTYLVSWEASGTLGAVSFGSGYKSNVNSNGFCIVTASATTTALIIECYSTGTLTFDNVSVKEISSINILTNEFINSLLANITKLNCYDGAFSNSLNLDIPELITNGTFTSNITGWTDSSGGTGSVAWNSGELDCITIDGSNRGKVSQTLTTVIGKTYRLEWDASGVVGAITFGTNYVTGISSKGYSVLTATATTTTLILENYSAGTLSFDNVSVKEISSVSSLNFSDNIRFENKKILGKQGLSVVDTDANTSNLMTAVNSILSRLREHGLIAT